MRTSGKRLIQLFEKELEDKTYFDFRFSLDGTMVKPREVEEGDDYIYIDEEGQTYPEEEVVRFVFDAKTKRSFAKNIRRVLFKREIPSLESLDFQHKEVREAIKDYGNGNYKSVHDNVKERIRRDVVAKYTPEYEIALYECVLLSLVERDLFTPSRVKGGISVDCKIDIDISDDFWSNQSPQTQDEVDDLFDELKFGKSVKSLEPIVRDSTDALETMIAFCDTIITEHEYLQDVATQLITVVTANIYASAEREAVTRDGLEPFRKRLAELLPDFMVDTDHSGIGKYNADGVSVVFGKTGNESQTERDIASNSGSIQHTNNDSGEQS